MKYLTFLQGNYVIPMNPKNTFPWLAIVNQPPIRLIVPYISFIYSTSTTTLAIQITKRLRGCGVIRLQRYVENLLTNAKDRTKSLKQIKYLINLPNQTNQALSLNKQTNQRPDFRLICLFTRLSMTAFSRKIRISAKLKDVLDSNTVRANMAAISGSFFTAADALHSSFQDLILGM